MRGSPYIALCAAFAVWLWCTWDVGSPYWEALQDGTSVGCSVCVGYCEFLWILVFRGAALRDRAQILTVGGRCYSSQVMQAPPLEYHLADLRTQESALRCMNR